jgi:hypothetical protein
MDYLSDTCRKFIRVKRVVPAAERVWQKIPKKSLNLRKKTRGLRKVEQKEKRISYIHPAHIIHYRETIFTVFGIILIAGKPRHRYNLGRLFSTAQ